MKKKDDEPKPDDPGEAAAVPDKSERSGAEAARAMEQSAHALAVAFLSANLERDAIPLKRLMDDCEKKILLTGLRATKGSQKKAAELLGLKTTALFEKMRKHGIQGRRVKLAAKLDADGPDE
jgi:DNA-binding NtrC family response regulator